jgi:8-oxo-dGTP pyrophosphatase MutT (NUDIX family)
VRSTARSCSTNALSAFSSPPERAIGSEAHDGSTVDAVAAELRHVLLDSERAAWLEVPGQVPSAVLVALYVPAPPVDQRAGELRAVFTRRPDDMRRHAGEISFPGGRREPSDSDLRATALREAEEEIGLPSPDVKLIGALPATSTFATNYAIYPFVGLVEPGREWTISAREVDEVIELSLSELLAGFRRTDVERRGVSFRTDAYVVGEHFIWGATARILGDLLDRLAPWLEPAVA